MRRLAVFILCTIAAIIGCTHFSVQMNEVERYYYKGKEAEAAQQWEQAFQYYAKAYKLVKERQGIIQSANNYPNTYKILYKAMDRVGANIDKPGEWKSPMRQRMESMQREMFERMQFSQNIFDEADALNQNNEYLEAMKLLDQVIEAYPSSGEAQKARKLKKEYLKQLEKYRKQLFEDAMLFYNQQHYNLAREAFNRLFATYPNTPEANKTKTQIEYYLQQIEQATKQEKPITNR
jgi:tetratricopeptide (TPR) repeat protein